LTLGSLHGNEWDGSFAVIKRSKLDDAVAAARLDDAQFNARTCATNAGLASGQFLGNDDSTVIVAGDSCEIDIFSTSMLYCCYTFDDYTLKQKSSRKQCTETGQDIGRS
jgi:hypothetical protein